MLTRVKSQSNPLNVQKKLITEPSIYLQQLQQLLADKQKKLSETASQMQKSVEELESNIELMKQRLSTLESARKKLEEELIFLKEKKRPEIVAAIAEARSHGDLKENAEYHAAKEEQSHNEGRITEINDIIARANVIDVTKLNNEGKVIFGSTVELEDLDSGEKINYKMTKKKYATKSKKVKSKYKP